MVVIDHPISWEQLMNIEEEVFFEDMMKCVADIERGLLAVNSDLHSDLEELLLLGQLPHPFILNGWGLQRRRSFFSVSPVD